MKVLVENMIKCFYLSMRKTFINTTRNFEATQKTTNPFGYVKLPYGGNNFQIMFLKTHK